MFGLTIIKLIKKMEILQKKRKYSEISKIDDINLFDGKEHLKIFNEYLNLLENFKCKMNELIDIKKKEKIKDSDKNIKDAKVKIKNIKDNIKYNKYQINKLNNSLENIYKIIEKSEQQLCDHDIYFEREYHNEKYYYCKKCSWTR